MQCDDAGDLLTTIVAIDAVNVKNLRGASQYAPDLILRELLKAYAGFSSPQPDLPVASPSTTAADSKAANQQIVQFADQLVAGVMAEVKCSIQVPEQSDATSYHQMQSLSDFADRQMAAIFQSAKEMSESSPSLSTSVGDFSLSLVADIVESAPETAFIEQLRSSTAEKSVMRYVDRFVADVMSSGLTEAFSSGSKQTLGDWAQQQVVAIIHSAIHDEVSSAV